MFSTFNPGKKILHYEILEAIGKGGMGEVYRAHDQKLGRTVAIKALPLSINQDDQARRRFVREAQSASRLNHPGIVTIHAIEEVDDFQFIVMEYVNGESLQAVLERGPLEWTRLVDIGLQIVEALGAAHAAGLIHRDLKPANIMINSEGKVKILDFGLAKIMPSPDLNTQTGSITKAGVVVGTLFYMSPEQTRAEKLDARTDIFSLGTVLYHAATGRMPFEGPSVLAVMHSIATTNLPAPSTLNPKIPQSFDSWIHRAMAKNQNDRFSSAGEMATRLMECKEVSSTISGIPKQQNSIAVLYFENLGGIVEQEYLRDGLTEDVITELSKVEKLRVFPRSAVAAFRDKLIAAQEIGRQLNSLYVLAGSLRKSGTRVRVTAQLIESDTGHSVWADRYDRELRDVFDLQDEIARSLATALSIKLTPAEEKSIGQKPAGNPEAYDFYLQGRRLFRRGTLKDMLSAVEVFQKAIQVDPGFAMAYAGLGHVCGRIHRYYDQNPKWMEMGIEACEKAMKIEPLLPDALSARAFLHYGHREYEEAIRYAKLALERKPDCEGAYAALGFSLNITDRLEEAARLADLAVEHNGDDYNMYLPYMTVFTRLGDTEKATRLTKQLLRVLDMHLEWVPDNVSARVLRASSLAGIGERTRSLEELQKALAGAANDARSLFNVACCYGLLGQKNEALSALKKAVENGYRHPDTIARDTDLACLHGDPEFDALIKRLSSDSNQ